MAGPDGTSASPSLWERLLAARAGDRPLVMGIVNSTPDSFFDGGRYASASKVRRRVEDLALEGADIIDIGGESTRPGSSPVAAGEQIERITPALNAALGQGLSVSVDTTDPAVARFAAERGVALINDVSCLRRPELAAVAAEYRLPIIIMHSRVPMAQMADFSTWPDDAYSDVVADISADWLRARELALKAGIEAGDIWFDPGIGFSKNARHSLEILQRLHEFKALDAPIVVGASRKSFISAVSQARPDERLPGSLAAAVLAATRGADVLRVHDVAETHQALAVSCAICSPGKVLGKQHVERVSRLSSR